MDKWIIRRWFIRKISKLLLGYDIVQQNYHLRTDSERLLLRVSELRRELEAGEEMMLGVMARNIRYFAVLDHYASKGKKRAKKVIKMDNES